MTRAEERNISTRSEIAARSTGEFEDEFVKKLQETVQKVKESREMEERYMLLQEMLKTERNEGRLEGMAVGKLKGKLEVVLENLGPLPSELSIRIENETDLKILESWLKAAKEAESMETFIGGIQQ